MRTLEILGEQMEIFLGCADLRVPEDDREPHDIPSVPQILGREGVAQKVKPGLGKAEVLEKAVVAPPSVPVFPLHALPCGEHQV